MRGISILAALSWIGCGEVNAIAVDGAVADSSASDASNPCTSDPCVLLSDDFSGANLNAELWEVAVRGGATVTQQAGVLSIRLPAAVDAWADLHSLLSFPVGTTFEAAVTFSGGQFYDHKGVGFASSRIADGCNAGESDAAMFRGQDDDGYIETKTAGSYACSLATDNYTSGPRTLRITRAGNEVLFRQDSTQFKPATANVPMMALPVRFSAYTYITAPMQPVQIDVDWVRVTRP